MSSDSSQLVDLATSTADHHDGDEEGKAWFTPPLYRQRYEKVYNILLAENVSSVADFGCSECRALHLFRDLPSVELLMGVDIDRLVMCDKIQSLKPLNIDHLLRRSRPLKIQLFLGNILEFDERLAGIEAVSMIEVIEHLTFDDLEKLPAALFGILQPRIVIITTPNAEYNVLFPNLVGFRHADHKFEWTRSEFSNWCSQVASDYSYDVEYDGVGDPPSDRASLGCCSQLAVFRRSRFPSETTTETRVESCLPYKLMGEVDYPVKIKTTTIEQDILNEAIYCMNFLSRRDDDLDDNEPSHSIPYGSQHKCIKLEDLKLFSQLPTDITADYIEKLREVLSEAGYKLTDDGLAVICPLDETDDSSSSLDNYDEDFNKPDTDTVDLQYNTEDNTDVPTENWDI